MASSSPPFDPERCRPDDVYYLLMSISIVAIIFIASNVIACLCCNPRQLLQDLRAFLRSFSSHHQQALNSIPACKYQTDQEQEQADAALCPVCLSVYTDGEEVRQLPQCNHSFHAPCIDMWLHSHSSCPVCRAKVSPPSGACSGVTRLEETSEAPHPPV